MSTGFGICQALGYVLVAALVCVSVQVENCLLPLKPPTRP